MISQSGHDKNYHKKQTYQKAKDRGNQSADRHTFIVILLTECNNRTNQSGNIQSQINHRKPEKYNTHNTTDQGCDPYPAVIVRQHIIHYRPHRLTIRYLLLELLLIILLAAVWLLIVLLTAVWLLIILLTAVWLLIVLLTIRLLIVLLVAIGLLIVLLIAIGLLIILLIAVWLLPIILILFHVNLLSPIIRIQISAS